MGNASDRDRFNFAIYLDKSLAKNLKQIQLDQQNRERFQEIAEQEVLQQLGMKWKSPYLFHESSLLVGQINIESDGRWLATTHGELSSLDDGRDLDNHITYNSHNIDTHKQAYALLACFTKWLDYAAVFLKE